MSKPLFSRKIKCLNCNKNFKSKLQHKQRVYVDSSYDNYGKCTRSQIKESLLLELIERRFERELSEEEIKEHVEKVEVDKEEFKIHLKNQNPIQYGGNTFIF